MKLILITPEDDFPNEHSLLCELFESGLSCLHVRKPYYSKVQLENYLNAIPDLYHKHCVLHYDHELYKRYMLAGFHVSEKQRKENYEIRSRQTLSTSFHSLDDSELKNDKYSYAFFSPVLKSISKQNYEPRYDLKEISSITKEAGMELYALGGVGVNNLKKLIGKGFAGVAVLGGVWNTSDPMASFLELKGQLNLL